MDKRKTFLDKCVKDSSGHIVLWQNPNVPLWMWIISSVVAYVFKTGMAHRLLAVIAFGGLFAWAYLEAAHGVNYFRRALGVVILIMIVLQRAR